MLATQIPTDVPATSSFDVLIDSKPEDHSLPAFMVSTSRGFLPRSDPVVTLPKEFNALESLLNRMPIKTASGEPGLLAKGEFGAAVDAELPDLSDAVEKYRDDLPLMNALYRDYSFLASAYLLEPCHLRFIKGEGYGLARDRLPKNISLPIVKVAEITGFKPFMEYAGSYALFNYRLIDPSKGLDYDNLTLIRAFEHGLDRTSSEAGFVLIHIAMVKNSGALVSAALNCLNACSQNDRDKFNVALGEMLIVLREINRVMNDMWNKSKPGDYTSFRTFIFGIAKQSMFPNGVIYEGVSDEPMFFRGESGANDSMIPLCDNLLQISMPNTPLTAILRDFRSYRPGNHRQFLEWVQAKSLEIHLKDYALQDPVSSFAYLKVLDQVRDFRWRHWCFTREYVLKQTRHGTATGGSPIVTWLPNQLQAVLAQMKDTATKCKDSPTLQGIMDLVNLQVDSIQKDIEKYCTDRDSVQEY